MVLGFGSPKMATATGEGIEREEWNEKERGKLRKKKRKRRDFEKEMREESCWSF